MAHQQRYHQRACVHADLLFAEKSIAIAFTFSGLYVGSGLGMLVTPHLVALPMGWRTAYYVYAVVNSVWVAVAWIILRDSPYDTVDHKIPFLRIGEAEMRLFSTSMMQYGSLALASADFS